MKKVPLEFGKSGKFAVVDDEDFERVNKQLWCYSSGYAVSKIEGTASRTGITLQKFILGKTPKSLRITIKNGDPLDCQKSNLTIATCTQINGRKGKIKSINGRPPTSKYKGVCWVRRDKKWCVRLYQKGVCHHLGRFSSEIDAALAYDSAAIKLRGVEWSGVNFPEKGGKTLPPYQKGPKASSPQNTRKPQRKRKPAHNRATTSAYRGVSQTKHGWKANLRLGRCKKPQYLGLYSTEEGAAKVVDRAAVAVFGSDYPLLNFSL